MSGNTATATTTLTWDTLASGAEISATVVMASGFVLPLGQRVREHYRIVRALGQGGMGQVLGVELVGSAEKQVYALKVVARPGGAPGKPLDAAEKREADAQAKVFAELLRQEAAKQDVVQRHGVSVARLFALVQLDDNSLGLRMEIARGRSLEAYLDEDAKRRRELAPDLDFYLVVMRKVLYQLRRLHELSEPGSPSGFVHSDIKPGNIFVDDGDFSDPFVTLLDFGVATAGHALVDNSRDPSGSGRKTLILPDAGGTIGFAPPHHFTGKPTPLSDVYAALVILFELVTLQAPWEFEGLPKTARNLFKLEDMMRRGPRAVRTLRPSISEERAAILDAFFKEEFKALQALADRAYDARGDSDAEVKRQIAEQLTSLAQEYQSKIDSLRTRLLGGRVSDAGGSMPRLSRDGASDTGERPTSQPKLPPAEEPTRALSPRDILSIGHARDDDEPIRLPVRPFIGWKLPVLAMMVAAGGIYLYTHGLPPEADRVVRPWLVRAKQIANDTLGSRAGESSDAGVRPAGRAGATGSGRGGAATGASASASAPSTTVHDSGGAMLARSTPVDAGTRPTVQNSAEAADAGSNGIDEEDDDTGNERPAAATSPAPHAAQTARPRQNTRSAHPARAARSRSRNTHHGAHGRSRRGGRARRR